MHSLHGYRISMMIIVLNLIDIVRRNQGCLWVGYIFNSIYPKGRNLRPSDRTTRKSTKKSTFDGVSIFFRNRHFDLLVNE